MTYDGLGNRLEVTTYTDGEGNTTRYVLDGGAELTAIGAENTTYYLYGLGAIGTLGESWSYMLQDGAGSTRQLVDEEGAVNLSVSYTPWGDTLEIYGSGMLNLGYLGGVYDAGTGLIYMGNGQYYDPSTGRFLTRGMNDASTNPYTPWSSDPAGMLIGPFGLIALLFAKKKKHTKLDALIVVLILFALMGFGSSIAMPVHAASVADISSPIAPRSYSSQAESATVNNIIPDNPGPIVVIDYSKADCGNAWEELGPEIIQIIYDFMGGYVYQFILDILGGPAEMLGSLLFELSESLADDDLYTASINLLPVLIRGMPDVIDNAIESNLQSRDSSYLAIYNGIKQSLFSGLYIIQPYSLAFFIGQQFGRRLAWEVAKAEIIIGGFGFLSGLSVDFVDGLINLGVIVGTGGVGELLAIPVSVPVVAIATGVAVAGVAVAGGGVLSIAYMAMNPVTPPSGFIRPKLNISSEQFGKKLGKHAKDFGLDPSKLEDRNKLLEIINDIYNNADEVRKGLWRGIGEVTESGSNAEGMAYFFRKGNDVVVTDLNGNFVTILKDGASGQRFIWAISVFTK